MIENNLKLVKSQFVPPDGVIYELAKKQLKKEKERKKGKKKKEKEINRP